LDYNRFAGKPDSVVRLLAARKSDQTNPVSQNLRVGVANVARPQGNIQGLLNSGEPSYNDKCPRNQPLFPLAGYRPRDSVKNPGKPYKTVELAIVVLKACR